jgi:hypothetical protein
VAPARRRFERALRGCEAAQTARLRQLLTSNAGTAYGRAHGFATISSVGEWQNRVPIVDYDQIESWVLRAAAGEANVLTTVQVRIFERTSGSTAANKLVPYTEDLLHEFSAATGPWLHDLYTSFPALAGTSSYWSISPAARRAERTAGGTPIGFEDDTEYFGVLERFALRHLLAVPTRVARLHDIDAWADASARHLVADGDLGLISVWHPSFLALLLQRVENDLFSILESVPPQRASDVRERLKDLPLGEALWPRLSVVSCWADGPAASAALDLRRHLPHAYIQPKGLLATEGVVSFPVQRGAESASVAAIASHFLEFIDLENPAARPRLAHQLAPGGDYAPVISTGGGLYRYRLGDAVRCIGYHLEAPLLQFQGRTDQVSDLCGEKLNPRLVAAAMSYAERTTGGALTFALLAPVVADPPHYCLYAEGTDPGKLRSMCEALERKLGESRGYSYARTLGQLGPIRGVSVRDGAARYLRARTAAGQRVGDVKPVQLDDRLDWSSVFGTPSFPGKVQLQPEVRD